MALSLLSAVVALALAATDAGPADSNAEDLQRMQGDWMVASRTVNGMKLTPQEAQNLFRTVTGNQYVVSHYSKPIGQGTFKLDATKTPRTIDSTPAGAAGQAGPILGIYEFDGDKLRICNAPPGKPRPTDFECQPGSTHTLIVWEPEKT